MSLSEWMSLLGAVFAGCSALIAAAAIYFPARRQASQNILEQAQISLERSHEALTSGGLQISPPARDRLNWLTAARHIERYKRLKQKITDDIHKTICEEQEEYWRHKIYICLNSRDLMQLTYYTHPSHPIEKRSALVIHDFAKWPEDRPDPIDLVDMDKMIANGWSNYCGKRRSRHICQYLE